MTTQTAEHLASTSRRASNLFTLPLYMVEELTDLLQRMADCNASPDPTISGEYFNLLTSDTFRLVMARLKTNRAVTCRARELWSARWSGNADEDAVEELLDCFLHAMIEEATAQMGALVGLALQRRSSMPLDVVDADEESRRATSSFRISRAGE